MVVSIDLMGSNELLILPLIWGGVFTYSLSIIDIVENNEFMKSTLDFSSNSRSVSGIIATQLFYQVLITSTSVDIE